MDTKQQKSFYLLWTLAIILSAALAFFILFYSFFAGNRDEASPAPAPISQEEISTNE